MLYVLTGQRSITEELTPDETALLDNYRASSPTNKDHLDAVSAAFAQSTGVKGQAGNGK